MKILDYALARLSESSTLRGAIFLAAAFGLQLSPSHQEAIITATLAVVGAINVIRKGQ
jgi:hypothetical protein